MCRSLASGGRRCSPDKHAASARRKANRQTRSKLSQFFKNKGMANTSQQVKKSPPSTIPYVVSMLELDGVISSTEMPGTPNSDPDMSAFEAALAEDGGWNEESSDEIEDSTSDEEEEFEDIDDANNDDSSEENPVTISDIQDTTSSGLPGGGNANAAEAFGLGAVGAATFGDFNPSDLSGSSAVDEIEGEKFAEFPESEDEYIPVGDKSSTAEEDEYIPVGNKGSSEEDEYEPVGHKTSVEEDETTVHSVKPEEDDNTGFYAGPVINESEDIAETDKVVSENVKTFNDAISAISSNVYSAEDKDISEAVSSINKVFGNDVVGMSEMKIEDMNEEQIEFLKGTSAANFYMLSQYTSNMNQMPMLHKLKTGESLEDTEKPKVKTEEEIRQEAEEEYKEKVDKIFTSKGIKAEDVSLDEDRQFSEGTIAGIEKALKDSNYISYSKRNVADLVEGDDELKEKLQKGVTINLANTEDDEFDQVRIKIATEEGDKVCMYGQFVNKSGESWDKPQVCLKSVKIDPSKDEGYMTKAFGWIEDEKKIKKEMSKVILPKANVDDDSDKIGWWQLNGSKAVEAALYANPSKLKPTVANSGWGNKDDISKMSNVFSKEKVDEEDYPNILNQKKSHFIQNKVHDNKPKNSAEGHHANAVFATLATLSAESKSFENWDDQTGDKFKSYKSTGFNALKGKYTDNVVSASTTSGVENPKDSDGPVTVTAISDEWLGKNKLTNDNGYTLFTDKNAERAPTKAPSISTTDEENTVGPGAIQAAMGMTGSSNTRLGENVVVSVDTYTGSDYTEINGWMKGRSRGISSGTPYIANEVAALSAFSESMNSGHIANALGSTGTAATTYRGVRVRGSAFMETSNFNPGDMIEADRFTSTSARGMVANNFAGGKHGENKVVRFVVTSDKSVDISPVGLGNEQETAVPKGGQFVVTRKEESDTSVTLHIVDKGLMDSNVKPEYLV